MNKFTITTICPNILVKNQETFIKPISFDKIQWTSSILCPRVSVTHTGVTFFLNLMYSSKYIFEQKTEHKSISLTLPISYTVLTCRIADFISIFVSLCIFLSVYLFVRLTVFQCVCLIIASLLV